mgnify:CR=1 FL=1
MIVIVLVMMMFQLTQELMEHCRNSVQTFELLDKKMRLRFALETIVKQHLPGKYSNSTIT